MRCHLLDLEMCPSKRTKVVDLARRLRLRGERMHQPWRGTKQELVLQQIPRRMLMTQMIQKRQKRVEGNNSLTLMLSSIRKSNTESWESIRKSMQIQEDLRQVSLCKSTQLMSVRSSSVARFWILRIRCSKSIQMNGTTFQFAWERAWRASFYPSLQATTASSSFK